MLPSLTMFFSVITAAVMCITLSESIPFNTSRNSLMLGEVMNSSVRFGRKDDWNSRGNSSNWSSTSLMSTGAEETGPHPLKQSRTQSKKTTYSSDRCGIRGPPSTNRKRIFGGKEPTHGDFPWQVFLLGVWEKYDYPTQACGGALLSDQWILTAAHCLMYTRGDPPRPLVDRVVAVLEAHNFEDDSEERVLFRGIEWKVDTSYSPRDLPTMIANDIGFVRIPSVIGKVRNFMPICLPPRAIDDEEQDVTIAGWGFIGPPSQQTSILQYIDTMTLSLTGCRAVFTKLGEAPSIVTQFINEQALCIDQRRGTAVCQGDSGGPLIRELNGVYYVIGLASMGPRTCGDSSVPSVFTRVKTHLDFICKETGVCSNALTLFTFFNPWIAFLYLILVRYSPVSSSKFIRRA